MERHFKKIFAVTVIVKLILAYFFPITSDEAYFLTWGKNLDINYYDHPPMTGWIVYLFSFSGKHIFFYRLFPIICGVIVAIAIYLIVRDIFKDEDRARLIAMAFLVAPLNILFALISTDTPLFLFVFLAGAFFYYAVNLRRGYLFLVSGILLGLAVLSKYFAGLLLIAFGGCLVIRWNRDTIRNGLILLFGAAPFVLLNLYWNYNSCWTNVMFNIFNRHEDVSLELGRFLTFLVFQLYLATPWLIYYLAKNMGTVKAGIKRDNNLFFHMYLIPISIIGLIAFHRTGLHWVLSFYPFLFFLLVYLNKEQILRIVKYSAIFSLIHIVTITAILSLPIETFKKHRKYSDIVMGFHGDEIYNKLKKYRDRYAFGTTSYATAAIMAYHSGESFFVFGSGSKHGRNDDKVMDFRELDGRNILILKNKKLKERDYRDYFKRIRVETIKVRQASFDIALGEGFNYQKYRELILTRILQKYYNIPKFLPVGDCFFYNKYFPKRE